MQPTSDPQTPAELSKKTVEPNPFKQFECWFRDAVAAVPLLPEAMALATSSRDGKPSIRTVLLKHPVEESFVFYTNYDSPKAREMDDNPSAALVFHWRELQRQICITGTVSRIAREESEAYFQTRPRGSQIAALASNQSQRIANRRVLEERFEALTAQYEGKEIPLPSNWGGYRLVPSTIEFWQGRPDRLHDRLIYRLESGGKWRLERLSP